MAFGRSERPSGASLARRTVTVGCHAQGIGAVGLAHRAEIERPSFKGQGRSVRPAGSFAGSATIPRVSSIQAASRLNWMPLGCWLAEVPSVFSPGRVDGAAAVGVYGSPFTWEYQGKVA